MREELRFKEEITKVVMSRQADRWYASILVRVDITNNPTVHKSLFEDKPAIGVDVGINTLATCSDGTKYPNPRSLKRYERKLRRAQRRLSKRVYRSSLTMGISKNAYLHARITAWLVSVKTHTTRLALRLLKRHHPLV